MGRFFSFFISCRVEAKLLLTRKEEKNGELFGKGEKKKAFKGTAQIQETIR